MAHEFLIKDIAFQAGLSTATVDRVINGRGGVRRQTQARIEAALNELRKQEQAALLTGRTFVFDVIMETPDRFSAAVRAAFEGEAINFLPSILRSRFHFSEQFKEREQLQLMQRIRSRGSHGVVLKAADTPGMGEAVAMLHEAGIPVITIATDLPNTKRIAYAGADNRAAGQTAAFLIGSTINTGHVLVTLSSSRFRGEEEREIGFRRLLGERWPYIGITEISEGYGRDSATGEQVRNALAQNTAINALYSIGGANRSVIEAFDTAKRQIACYVAHDLDADNISLLRAERLSFVLHHDLNSDAAQVFRTFLSWRRAIAEVPGQTLSALNVITPFNLKP